jgi:hypothetical protein
MILDQDYRIFHGLKNSKTIKGIHRELCSSWSKTIFKFRYCHRLWSNQRQQWYRSSWCNFNKYKNTLFTKEILYEKSLAI